MKVGIGNKSLRLRCRDFILRRKMVKPEKIEAVNMLKEKLSQSRIVVLADYRGITAAEMNELRQKFKERGCEFRVVKNTLTRIALEGLGWEWGPRFLEGPTAMILGYEEESATAKIISEYNKATGGSLRIKGGILSRKVLTPGEIELLATLPSRDELLAKALGGMKAPLSALVFSLSSLLSGLVNVLKGRLAQMEGG